MWRNVNASDSSDKRQLILLLVLLVAMMGSTLRTSAEDGAALYQSVCVMCHTDGSASEKGPSLLDSEMVKQDPMATLRIVLHGSMGSSDPNAIMPPANWMSNEEAAALVAYVMEKFGGRKVEVTPAMAEKAREAKP